MQAAQTDARTSLPQERAAAEAWYAASAARKVVARVAQAPVHA